MSVPFVVLHADDDIWQLDPCYMPRNILTSAPSTSGEQNSSLTKRDQIENKAGWGFVILKIVQMSYIFQYNYFIFQNISEN